MDHRSALVATILLAGTCTASAFVSPSPPPGFGGTPGNWTFSPSSPADQLGKIVRGPGPSIAGVGETRAAYKLAGGAARALARGVLMGGVPGALVLGTLWLAEHCFERQDGQWIRTCGNAPPDVEVSDGHYYYAEYNNPHLGTFRSAAAACAAYVAYYSGVLSHITINYPNSIGRIGTCGGYRIDANGKKDLLYTAYVYRGESKTCPAGWYVTDAGCVANPPPATVRPEVIEEEMAEKPLPLKLPPGIPYPIETPIWNPSPEDPEVSQPLRVPQGIPQKIPDTNPQKYRQPITEWTHSPTASDPWRMDVTPKDVVSESPIGQTGPESGSPGGPPSVPRDEAADLCEKNPDVVACQRLGDIAAQPVPNENRHLAISKDPGWGPEMGRCPEPKTARVLGVTLSLPFTMLCDFALGIRPLLIAFAWLSAAMTFMGLSRRD